MSKPVANSLEVLETPEKSTNDRKEYRLVRLKNNGLTVLLISQANLYDNNSGTQTRSKKKTASELLAAIGLCVEVGSFFDFVVGVPGMAHFCEHMMFLGSQKYPKENAFEKYLTEQGGSSNAFTFAEHTIFTYEVLEKGLEGALDHLASLLKAPLMSKETMKREREAVDSEFQERKHNVESQIEQLIVSMGNSQHPASNFNWGNLKSLKEDISDDELFKRTKEFCSKYYVANRMHLCIQSKLSLDDLQELVLKHFQDVPHDFESDLNLPVTPSFSHKNVYRKDFYDKMQCLNSNIDETRLHLTWVLPPMLDKYKTSPLEYVKSVLESEDPGCLLDSLMEKNLAYGLDIELDYADYEYNSLYTLFKFNVTLTEHGNDNIEEVLDMIFSYLLFLKEQKADEDYFNYLRDLAYLEFLKHTEKSSVANVENLAANMKYFEPKHVINGSELFLEFDESHINSVIKALNKPKFNMFLISQDCDKELKEKWFKFEYSEEEVPEYCKNAWQNRAVKDEFSLPLHEEVVLKTFTIYYNSKQMKNVPKYPKKIFENKVCEAWYRIDDKFLTSNSCVYLRFMSPLPFQSLENSTLQRLHFHLVENLIDQTDFPQEANDAEVALFTHETGLTFEFKGHHKAIHNTIKVITKSLADASDYLDEDVFETCKASLKQLCMETLKDGTEVCKNYLENVLYAGLYTERDIESTIDGITIEMMKNYSRKWVRKLFIQVLAQGNLLKNHATNIVVSILKNINCKEIKNKNSIETLTREMKKGKNRIQIQVESAQNSPVLSYYEIGPKTIKSKCLLDLFTSIIKEPLYFRLRTQEQLAYNVTEGIVDTRNVVGFTIIVGSSEEKNPVKIVIGKIENFLNDEVKKILEDFNDEKFENFCNTLVRLKSLIDLDLSTEVERNWEEIKSKDQLFNRTEREINLLKTLNKSDLLEFYKKHLLNGNAKNLIVNVVIEDAEENLPRKSEIIDTERKLKNFKDSLNLYPNSGTIL